ncbi:MAG: M24 family metallopeptidase [Candidatus Hodarchaeota archaeon]
MTNISTKVHRLQKCMRKSNIDCIIVPLGINFRWLFGIMEEPSERLLVSIINAESQKHPVEMVVPSFEADRMKKTTGISNIISWEETQDPYNMLSELILANTGKIIGIEPKMWYSVYHCISKNLPEKIFISAEQVFNSLRSIKDEEEQKILLKASQRSGDAIVKTLNDLEAGISENEVQSILRERLTWGTREKVFSLVQFGENSTMPHYHGGERKLKKDDVVLIDAGGTLRNYWGDITITSVFGKADDKFKEIYEIVFNANEKGKEAVKQTKLPCEIDTTVRDHITKNGYGKYFTHRTGHGLGLEGHEHPYIVANNKTPLVSGNVFTIEPGIYLPGKFGIRIEDNIVKTIDRYQTSNIPRHEILEI